MKSHGVSRSDRAFASGVATLHKHAEMSHVIQAGSLMESCMRDGTRPFSPWLPPCSFPRGTARIPHRSDDAHERDDDGGISRLPTRSDTRKYRAFSQRHLARV